MKLDEGMTFKELAEKTLKEYPDGIWVHFQEYCGDEIYLDAYYLKEFEYYLNKKVKNYYIDECDYEVLEVELKRV